MHRVDILLRKGASHLVLLSLVENIHLFGSLYHGCGTCSGSLYVSHDIGFGNKDFPVHFSPSSGEQPSLSVPKVLWSTSNLCGLEYTSRWFCAVCSINAIHILSATETMSLTTCTPLFGARFPTCLLSANRHCAPIHHWYSGCGLLHQQRSSLLVEDLLRYSSPC